MKKLICVFLMLFMTNSFANDCKSIDLNKTVNIVMGLEESENDSFIGYFMDLFELTGCILEAESMDDLNLTKQSLRRYKLFLENSYLEEIKLLKQEIADMEETISMETNSLFLAELKKSHQERLNELETTMVDYTFVMIRINQLLAL